MLHFTCVLVFVTAVIVPASCSITPFLKDGGGQDKGRAMVITSGVEKTICDGNPSVSGWPTAFCKDLGFPGAAEVKHITDTALDDASTYPVYNTPDACGNSMHDCIETSNCDHDDDVYVRCESKYRITGGQENNGRADIFYNGAWFNLCADNLSQADAWPSLFCQALGYSGHFRISYTEDFGPQTVSRKPQCPAGASSISDCTFSDTCSLSKGINIHCLNDRINADVMMLFDVSGSMEAILSGEDEQHFLTQETEFLQMFFDFTSSNGHFEKYNVHLKAVPFNSGLFMGEMMTLNYGEFASALALRNSEAIRLNSFKDGIEGKSPEGKTDIGTVLNDLTTKAEMNGVKLVILISDYVNMFHNPKPVDSLTWYKNNNVDVVNVILDSPRREDNLYAAMREATISKLGFDVSEGIREQEFQTMFDTVFPVGGD